MTVAADSTVFEALERDTVTDQLPGITIAAICSIGAGTIHAAAIGIHAEQTQLARIFVVTAVLQLGAGLVALVRPSRLVALAAFGINVAAVVGWLATRITGISWIDGLQVAERPQFADTACALLGAVAAGAALAAFLAGWQRAASTKLMFPGLVVAALVIPAMMTGSTHVHDHGSASGAAAGTDGHSHADGSTAAAAAGATGATGATADESIPHDHTTPVDPAAAAVAAVWPRPWDPTGPIDFSGVPGVTAEQLARAEQLTADTLRDLPKWSTTAAAVADGYRSIGDAGTGSEHYIKASLINDDIMLDPTQPESLVYTVKGDQRILAGAMFIASDRPSDDPTLTNYAGALMTWHNHGNLCWSADGGTPRVVGVTDANGKCSVGVNSGGESPMVHVWITPHPCGVFSALEGVGAGQASVPDSQRVDQCAHTHGTGKGTVLTGDATTAAAPSGAAAPFDPTKRVDLSGMPGVTPEQQAAAEQLVSITLDGLPQWSDYKTAEAAGFRSIGDGATGFEHYIQWDWINDDVTLDPNKPESLVFQPQPNGSKKLLSAMYMLPDTTPLSDVPDIGGALMQWHIHDNLCFTTGDAPKVAGITTSTGGCPAGLEKIRPAPMIHVWITPHKCGPFAALEGVGAGQIEAGEERLCDHRHGANAGF